MSGIDESVAIAIWQEDSQRALGRPRMSPWSEQSDKMREEYVGRAQAAISEYLRLTASAEPGEGEKPVARQWRIKSTVPGSEWSEWRNSQCPGLSDDAAIVDERDLYTRPTPPAATSELVERATQAMLTPQMRSVLVAAGLEHEPAQEEFVRKYAEIAATALQSGVSEAGKEREACVSICQRWLDNFEGAEIDVISPHEYAAAAVKDIRDAISARSDAGEAGE